MKKWIVLCVIVSNVLNAKVDTISIDRAIEISLKQSPDIRISNLDFKGALERNKFQNGYYLPTVNFSATTGKQEMKFKEEERIGSTALIGGMSVSWLLYDFGKTSGMVDSFEHESVAYKATMYQQIAYKILMVKTNYYEVLKAKSIIGVHQKNLLLQENQLTRAKRYFESGIKTIIDVSDAQVRLSQAKLELNSANYNLKLRRAILEESMGVVDANYRLKHQKLPLPNIIKSLPLIKTSLAQLEGFAYDHRQELKRADAIKDSMESKIKSVEGDYYPTVALKGDYSVQSVTDDIASFTSQNQWKGGVVMEWNLFSGHQTDSSVQSAKIDNMKSIAQRNQVRLLIKREVVDSYLNLNRSKDAIVLSKSILESSQNKYNQAQKRYDNELSDYIELQEARQGYITSLSNLVTLYYDYYISMSRLDYAVGR